MLSRLLALALLVAPLSALSQAIPAFPLRQGGPVLRQHVEAGQPFTVAGPEGMLVGQQQGLFEAWVLPVKLLSHLTLEAEVEGYPVPLDLNAMAREIEVRPDRTTITYSHIAVTVRQIMFSPDDAPAGTGPVVLFQVDSVRPVNLTFRFTPDMREMWPMPSFGTPGAEWIQQGSTGYYALHTDSNALTGGVSLPGATSGTMAPYQERAQVHPLELHLHVDPRTDRGKFFPLLLAVGRTPQAAAPGALGRTLTNLNLQIQALYKAHVHRLELAEKAETTLSTPDEDLNRDLLWAQTSIHQLRAKAPSGETALVAGYYASGDSARPGFGWFFGRDALYTLYAVDSYGDFPLARTELDFLIKRQRADGKIMHEYSQTAGELAPPNDWASMPYEYAAADATPLFLTVMLDYVNASGDIAYLRSQRDAVLKAWRFEITHDSDGDGIYDNAQGTGWVESWPPGMPHQEIYLALLDQQASAAMASLAKLLEEPKLASEATARAARVHQTLEREYYRSENGTYAFSFNGAGKLDTTATIFPAIAYWNTGSALDHPDASLRQWSSHDFATDWGARDLAESDPLYDPISYHQGSVWPLFTGWAALAQYRANHPLAGYQAAMQNADLTNAQDIGAVTELLSGAFFEPFGRSTSHQLWSSAMVITPILRGLFGLEPDALHHSLRVSPNLPADWPSAEIHNLHIGASTLNLRFRREDATLVVTAEPLSGPGIALTGADGQNQLHVPVPAVEVSIPHTLPLPGSRTQHFKVLNETRTDRSYTLELEAQAGTELRLAMHRNDSAVRVLVEGAALAQDELTVTFPSGTGYRTQRITLSW